MALLLRRKHKNKVLMLLAVLSMSLGYAVTTNAQMQNEEAFASLIESIITKNNTGAGGTTAGVKLANRSVMGPFYQSREFAPLWVSRNGDTGRAAEALDIFKASWTHGLNPKTYHAAEIGELLESKTAEDKARLEVLVTDAAVRYGRDLSGMRINPGAIKQKAEYWRKPLTGEAVLERIKASASPVRALRELEPNTPLYKALQKELVSLTEQRKDYESVLPLGFGGSKHFTPGSKNKDVAGLRVRLGITHRAEWGAPNFYDDETAAAVMRLQREHGLEADGIIGPQTLSVLNQTTRARMEQVVANLERLRWLEQERPERYLLVNIPQQLVWAVEDGEVEFESKVVVGMPQRRTMDFRADVTGIRFNPNWTVPMGIKMADFVPKLIDNPDYMTQKGMEIIQGGESIDPSSVDWENVSRSEISSMRFVQAAGDNNALGQIRVLMPNDYNIYMHDTNHPEFFEKDVRTYSSGCIRLSEPEKIAEFVLAHTKDWSTEKMNNLIASGRTVEISADKPFPVFVIYQSMWLDDSGRLVYGADVYKRDKQLIDVLAQMDGYSLPKNADGHLASASAGGGDSALAYND